MRCFVIQPFNVKYDKRFQDVFAPSIAAAGFEPYRVDRDPAVSIPIEEIEKQIRSAAACLADITENNPNVWFELGYAIACKKELCLVCAKDRPSPFPFDIQHRKIIEYSTESSSDFDQLRRDIEKRLGAVKNALECNPAPDPSQATIAPFDLEAHDLICLAVLAAEQRDIEATVPHWRLKEAIEKAGIADVMKTGKFSDAYLRQVRDRVSIADYAGRRIVWDKRKSRPDAGDFWACCPFHQEQTASFHILDGKAVYKCFGCGEKGDIFTLAMKMEGLTFREAVGRFAREVGMPAVGLESGAYPVSLIASLSVHRLRKLALIECITEHDHDGDAYTVYRVSGEGWRILDSNRASIAFPVSAVVSASELDDEIPF